MRRDARSHQLYLFRPPYRLLVPISVGKSLERLAGADGSALVWCMGSDGDPDLPAALRNRPGGIPLLVVLPRAEEVVRPQDLFSLVDQCRPHSLLPFHETPDPLDIRTLLAGKPPDLPASVVEYLGWRGLVLDTDLRRTIRRVLELSSEVQTVSGLARGLYMSRRALGRRFLKEGLPVPSHWLQFGRVLRVALDLQRAGSTLMAVAYEHGYPDGFSLSNQMKRLTGLRPSETARHLGWEWIVERWIRRELREGGFGPDRASHLRCRAGVSRADPDVDLGERQPA
jgi:AraC-like DNA-binding protein